MLLGEMYDRYDKFNISLNFIAGSRTGSTAEDTPDNRTVSVRMRGLNFTSSYSQASGNNNNSIVLSTVQVPLTNNTAWENNYFTQQYFTFQKQETATITIDLISVLTDTYPTPSTSAKLIGHLLYSFNIFGCNEYQNTKSNEDLNFDLDLRKIF